MAEKKWTVVSGKELEEAYNHPTASLEEYVPSHQAVYLWRRSLKAPREAFADPDTFATWLDATLQTPSAEVREKKLSHFMLLERLVIHSAGLKAKMPELKRLAAKRHNRKWIARYVEKLAQFAPPLYCGETANLSDRIKDHISGESDFARKIPKGRVPGWSDLELVYYSLGEEKDRTERAKELRTLLELITTSLSVSGYVDRPG